MNVRGWFNKIFSSLCFLTFRLALTCYLFTQLLKPIVKIIYIDGRIITDESFAVCRSKTNQIETDLTFVGFVLDL